WMILRGEAEGMAAKLGEGDTVGLAGEVTPINKEIDEQYRRKKRARKRRKLFAWLRKTAPWLIGGGLVAYVFAGDWMPVGSCNIKGNIAVSGEKIYYLPHQEFYDDTRISPLRGERWFCSQAEARAAGWRPSGASIALGGVDGG